jgi:monothiol glutaredoxin
LKIRVSANNIQGIILEAIEATLQQQIAAIIASNRVVLFMKGSPQAPQCGFSAAASRMLVDVGVTDFAYVDVLENQALREGIKTFSSWPTIPQLYVDQEFVGGADIMSELHSSGELAKLLQK